MTGRDNELWQDAWRRQDIDFHQSVVNPLLLKFWPKFRLTVEDRIFVPLCGKSLDLLWLAKQGHKVIGVELSPLAVRAFFRENKLQPTRRKVGNFTLWEHGRIGILCGDFFKLTAADLGDISVVFDRASLTALPDDIRGDYIAQLRRILPAGCRMLLLTTEEPDEGETQGQPFAVADEIASLYTSAFEIELGHVESSFEADPDPAISQPVRIEQKVYFLTPKSDAYPA
ncbi:MAG: thiopurine S-methyltransferase [Gammaproteobacteria bacterium]|nr:thiopurine S-methyltransferase [Gammaproteobacteria bacterium]MBU1603058.1 thiopurine S-methyltransferase [Gammaproteobacteria bacterium]MBU2433763.1 thiopurine S-methyltransferase [Gammaproteobacteria bacterium]MBU2449933.1 thiopurine S-methyltransferase [Gammaproteobacteria bacterium]